MAITISGDTPNFSAATITTGTVTTLTSTTGTVTTLNAPSGVLATQNGMTGIAKAWVQFNGTTGATIGSFNISSFTRNATGDYTATFTTAMPNTTYCAVGSTVGSTSGNSSVIGGGAAISSTSSCRFFAYNSTNAALQSPDAASIIFFSS